MAKNWLIDKTVIVTGASSGIGSHLVRILLTYGCKVVGVSRDGIKAEKFAQALNNERYCYYCFDVGVKSGWEKFLEYLNTNCIQPDVIINNAGILPPFRRASSTHSKVYEESIKVNYLSAVYSYEFILPLLKASSTPTIVNISSSSALAILVGTSAYTAAKTALRAYTECIMYEHKDIYVASVCPGFAKTDIFREQKHSSNEGIIGKVSMPADKMARKIIKKLRRRKRRIVVGIDAHLMSGFYRIAPKFSAKLFAWVFKKAKLPLFDEVFSSKNG